MSRLFFSSTIDIVRDSTACRACFSDHAVGAEMPRIVRCSEEKNCTGKPIIKDIKALLVPPLRASERRRLRVLPTLPTGTRVKLPKSIERGSRYQQPWRGLSRKAQG